MPRKPIRPHVFVPSGKRSYGVRICARCDSLEGASVHNVPDRSDDERLVDARKVGERGDQAD